MSTNPTTGLPYPNSFATYCREWVKHFKDKGYLVKYYEIVNEPWFYFDGPWNSTKAGYYLQLFNACYDAMHAENNQILASNDASLRNNFLTYWKSNGGKLDTLNFHKYDSNSLTENDAKGLERAEKRHFDPNYDSFYLTPKQARQIWGKNLPVINSESNFGATSNGGTDPRLQKAIGAVWTAIMIRGSILNDVKYSIYFDWASSKSWETTSPSKISGGFGFGMINSDDKKPWYPYYVQKMIGPNLSVGDSIVNSTSLTNVSSLAWIHNNKLNILLIHKSTGTKTISLQGVTGQLSYQKIDDPYGTSYLNPTVQTGTIYASNQITLNGYTVMLLQQSIVPTSTTTSTSSTTTTIASTTTRITSTTNPNQCFIDILSASKPADTISGEITNAKVQVKNTGSIGCYAYVKCVFDDPYGSSYSVEDLGNKCQYFNPGVINYFYPGMLVNRVGTWNVSYCYSYSASTSSCSDLTKNDGITNTGIFLVYTQTSTISTTMTTSTIITTIQTTTIKTTSTSTSTTIPTTSSTTIGQTTTVAKTTTIAKTTTTIPSSPVGYWKFDEGSGSIAYDSSGNGNDGSIKASGINQVSNPSFENDKQDWGTGYGDWQIVTDVKYHGSKSSRFQDSTGDSDDERTGVVFIPVTPGQKITVSLFSKGENILQGTETWYKAYLIGRWIDANNQVIDGYYPDMSIGNGVGTWDWKRSSKTYTVPSNAVYYRFSLGLRGNSKGTLWVDAVQVEYGDTLTYFTDSSWVSGKSGKALEFDGIDDYVEIPHSDSISGFTNALTVSFWIKPGDTTRRQTMLNKFNAENGQKGWFIDSPSYSGTDLGFYASQDGINYVEWHANYAPVTGTWYHITVVWKSGEITKFYVNGAQVSTSGTATISQIYNNVGVPLYIGKSQYASDREFKGMIDEVKVWNRALTAEEIMNEYQKNMPLSVLDIIRQFFQNLLVRSV
jgi:hypothetical protein